MVGERIACTFKSNIVQFLDELIDQFPSEVDFILARIYLKDQVEPEKIILKFIDKLMPYETLIKNRDESLFMENKFSLFNDFKSDTTAKKVNHFQMLWKSSEIDQSDRDVIWQWLDAFCMLAHQYQNVILKNDKAT